MPRANRALAGGASWVGGGGAGASPVAMLELPGGGGESAGL